MAFMAISFLPVMATSRYPQAMNPEPKPETTTARFLIEGDLWEDFRLAARAQHPKGRSPRGAVLRDFVLWYMRRPGASAVKRPEAGPWSSPEQ